MILKCGIFFNVKDLDFFCKNELFDLTKYKNLDINFFHEKIQKGDMKPLSTPISQAFTYYEGYTFRQKDSFVIYVNNAFDNWVTNIEFTCAKYGYKAVYIYVNDESKFPAYKLHFYNGKSTRIIYSLKDGERWIFFKKGNPQDFEMGDTYSERGATKKFNYYKLKNFCNNLGLEIESSDFLIPIETIYHTYVA